MSMPLSNYLREDLIVTTNIDRQTSAQRYLIKDPISQETFEFGEEEYFLCQKMDGTTSVSEILAAFEQRFHAQLSEADYQEFARQIASFGLLESPERQLLSPEPNLGNGQQNPPVTKRKPKHHSLVFLWKLRNPDTTFSRLARWTKPLHAFFRWSTWLLVPLLPIAIFTFWNNMPFFWHDVSLFVEGVPFILTYLADIIILNFCGRVIQSTVFTAYGGQSTVFGLTLALGFKPHFYVDLKEFRNVPRIAQLWVYAAPLIMRLFIFSFGVIFWYSNRNSGTDFSIWFLLLAHASLLTFLLMACPLLPLYGYYFMITAFQLPDNFLFQSYKALGMILKGRSLPSFLSTKDKLILVSIGISSVVFSVLLLFLIISNFALGLITTFPGIFGTQTALFIFLILLFIGLRKPISRRLFPRKNTPVMSPPPSNFRREINKKKPLQVWLEKGAKFLLLAGLVALLFMPYRTMPGGSLQLLTPRQVAIQAEVDGKSKITRVMFSGGNEQLIPKGTVIAQMEDIDIENNIESLQSQIEKTQSDLNSKQSYLDKLLATPRPEDVEVARNQVESVREEVEQAKKAVTIAKQDLEVIKQQIVSALTQGDYYSREASRLEIAYKEGAIALNLLEEAQRQADTKKIEAKEKQQSLLTQQHRVEEARIELATKQRDLQTSESQLQLVLSGPHPDEIKQARHNVEAARAELERLKKEQQQDRNKLKLTTLVMPLDGYLITPYLETKVGSYLEQGQTFAIAQDATSILAEVQVPEYDVGQFSIGKKVEVKLAAYPTETITGKVTAINPSATDTTAATTSEQSPGRFLQVLVEIPYSGRILKSGMSGYAKIEGPVKPVIVAFTSSIVRFFQIEIWSWLP
jgi:multidrug resistance efflux pump